MARHRERVHPNHVIITTRKGTIRPAKNKNRFKGMLDTTKVSGSAEMKEWLNNCTVGHWYFVPPTARNSKELYVEFCSDKDAMMFKLSWGGTI